MVSKIHAILLFVCVSLCMSQTQGVWKEKTYIGADKCVCSTPYDTTHYEYTQENAVEEADNRTHYHYEYNFMDHVHYVTINYVQGMGRRGSDAGLLAFTPFNRTVATAVPTSSFKFDLPEGATVEEQYHYGYTYAYHDHQHTVSAFDAEMLPWWEMPAWFKTTEDVGTDFKFEYEAEKAQPEAQTVDVKQAAQQLLAPKTPEQLREMTKQADATGTVRKEGPYVKYPVKTASGYDFIKVPVPDTKTVGKAAGDQTTHLRYSRNSVNHKWYIPIDEQTTVTKNKNVENEKEVTTTFRAGVVSDKTRVVVHYHINNMYHLHDHMVFYAENNWLKKQDVKCPFLTKGLPAVVPGAKPAGDNSTDVFMNTVLPENHPADAQVTYNQVYGHFSRDHKQQLYRDGDIKSESGATQGKINVFSYSPVSTAVSNNNVEYTHLYMVHEHNHTVLLRGASPPGVIQLNAESAVDEFGEPQKDIDLILISHEDITIVDEVEVETGYGVMSWLLFLGALVAAGFYFKSQKRRQIQNSEGYQSLIA